MASRPFASVAVALDARGEQTELLQHVVDVSLALLLAHTHANTQIITKLLLKKCNIVQESETNRMPESSLIFSSSHGVLIQASLDVQVLLLTYERLFFVRNN